eukprot:2727173-Alexandrium_andersonii.AAC.1
MITDGEITVGELSAMWAGLPSRGGLIDALTFRDFIHQIDELFEHEEEELEDLNVTAGDAAGGASTVVPGGA